MSKKKTIVMITRKEDDRYYLKFPFLDMPVAMSEKSFQNILKADNYAVVEVAAS